MVFTVVQLNSFRFTSIFVSSVDKFFLAYCPYKLQHALLMQFILYNAIYPQKGKLHDFIPVLSAYTLINAQAICIYVCAMVNACLLL